MGQLDGTGVLPTAAVNDSLLNVLFFIKAGWKPPVGRFKANLLRFAINFFRCTFSFLYRIRFSLSESEAKSSCSYSMAVFQPNSLLSANFISFIWFFTSVIHCSTFSAAFSNLLEVIHAWASVKDSSTSSWSSCRLLLPSLLKAYESFFGL